MIGAAVNYTATEKALMNYRQQLQSEWKSILVYWKENMVDHQYGGFYGSINDKNIIDKAVPKGIVLNSRILWTFSATYRHSKNQQDLQTATRAFDYICNHFIDIEYGGVYWSVDERGNMFDGRKQIYGLAFTMYGCSEYYKATGNKAALKICKDLFSYIEEYSADKQRNGYIEAFTREWKQTDDLRLSEKDDNEVKTMNTHLHIIEAYANLYTVWPDETLRSKIVNLLFIFDKYIIDQQTGHLHLFMDDEWNVRSTVQSYGHDIEAAWLLLQCAEVINDDKLIAQYKELSVKIAAASLKGLDKDGGLWYEYDSAKDHLIKEKHSWPQAEAMTGYFTAWQLTNDEKYLEHSLKAWEFIQQYLVDQQNGEWHWGVYSDYSLMQKEKAGFWKCPYHNSRACLEIISRISAIV